MPYGVTIEFVNLFLAGLLAGAEVVVRFGVRAPITVLDERPQIELRQALVRSLRVLVPALYVPTAATGVAVAVHDGAGPGVVLRMAALVAICAWTVITFTRTVPINKGLLEWRPDAPPANWRALIQKWERLNTARAVAAVLAFALFLAAVAA